MPAYTYTALTESGKEVRGSMTADSREEALGALRTKGIIIVTLDETGLLNREVSFSFLQKKPSPREMAVFCRQMVSILSAGVPVSKALLMLEEQTDNKLLREAAAGCRLQIEAGSSLAEAMSRYRVFPSLFCTMAAAGEESGSLDISFARMAERCEKTARLKGMIKKASIYPAVVALVSVIVTIIMMTVIVPEFEDILGRMGAELPFITRCVMACSHFLRHYCILLLAVIFILAAALILWRRSPDGRARLDSLALKLPLFGKLTVKTACANISVTLSTLLAAGIPLIQALEITAATMTNTCFRDALLSARNETAVGTGLSDALRMTGVFPPLVFHMTGIGEQTGNLTGMYSKIADYYDEEVKQTTEQIMALLEPLIIVLLAAVVGTIVISLILPMAGMYRALDTL